MEMSSVREYKVGDPIESTRELGCKTLSGTHLYKMPNIGVRELQEFTSSI